MKYNEMTFGRMEAIINKLGGEEGVEKFLSGKTKVVEAVFPIWKTVTLGLHKTILEYENALKEVRVDTLSSKEIMNSKDFIISQEKITINLFALTVKDLGFTEWTTIDILQQRAFSLGFSLCPLEVGPALALNSGLENAADRVDLLIQTTGTLPEGNYLETFQISKKENSIYLHNGPIAPKTVVSPDFDYQVKYVFAKN